MRTEDILIKRGKKNIRKPMWRKFFTPRLYYFGKKGRNKWKKYNTLIGESFGGWFIFLYNAKPTSFGGTQKLY